MSQYYASSNKKGELFELEEELNSTSFDRKKEAIKKVIAHMTIGKDVSALFQPVIKCLEFPEIELKKLVYLYIINYSRNKPDDAIMVIQLFRKDIQNKTNPLLRALAVRTMGCIRVHKLNEYLHDPLKDALGDQEAYVRKTAALCIPKIYEISPELVSDHGIIEVMQNLLQTEANALVLANLIVGLSEISKMKKKNLIVINFNVLQRLLLAVNECMEWGQIFIMDYLVFYQPENSKEAETIIERIIPRLSHINPAVVFAAVKVIIKYLDSINSEDIVKHLCTKLTSSLISLLSWDKQEIKFCVLRNIPHILAKRPDILSKDIKCFFCNFNEPYYIKNQKLSILSQIVDQKNFELMLNELKLYVQEPDPNFVSKSIKTLCSITIRFPKAVDKSLAILVESIQNIKEAQQGGQQYVQDLIISMQKIYRKYPQKIEYLNGLKETIDIIDFAFEEQAKAAAVWLIGEFAEEIPKSIDLITARIENFVHEQRAVQLDILTAAVKVFVKYPDDGKNFIQSILETAAYKTSNPDVRDRAFIYWRMLSSDPEKAKNTVLSEKPQIQEEVLVYEQEFLENMIQTMGMVSSVFHKTEQSLLSIGDQRKLRQQKEKDEQKSPSKQTANKEEEEEKQQDAQTINNNTNNNNQEVKQEQQQKPRIQEDLLDIFDDEFNQNNQQNNQNQQPQQQQQQQQPQQNQKQQQKFEENLLDLF